MLCAVSLFHLWRPRSQSRAGSPRVRSSLIPQALCSHRTPPAHSVLLQTADSDSTNGYRRRTAQCLFSRARIVRSEVKVKTLAAQFTNTRLVELEF